MGKKRNWKQYNKQLVHRGNINFWISPDVIKSWKAPRKKKNGHPFVYSDNLIQAISYIRFKFSLSLREVEVFFTSLSALIQNEQRVPCYTQICRRMRTLNLPCAQ